MDGLASFHTSPSARMQLRIGGESDAGGLNGSLDPSQQKMWRASKQHNCRRD